MQIGHGLRSPLIQCIEHSDRIKRRGKADCCKQIEACKPSDQKISGHTQPAPQKIGKKPEETAQQGGRKKNRQGLEKLSGG